MADTVLAYDDLPWAAPSASRLSLSVLADLVVAAACCSSYVPFRFLAALLIWLEDRGPVFMHRSAVVGWEDPFTVLNCVP